MKRTAVIIFLLTILINSSCYYDNKKSLVNRIDTANNLPVTSKVTNRKMSFFDSILNKSGLTLPQLRKHTLIDSFYINQATDSIFIAPYSRFSGDTIYYVNLPFPIVVIKYSGLNCSEKYLLVYKKSDKKNIDHKLVSQNCDDDGDDEDYNSLAFKMINDTLFYTADTYYKRREGHKDSIIVTRQFYKINKEGKINSITSPQ